MRLEFSSNCFDTKDIHFETHYGADRDIDFENNPKIIFLKLFENQYMFHY